MTMTTVSPQAPTTATTVVPTATTPRGATPRLDLDVRAAVTAYRNLVAALPGTAVHYAVKANPDPVLLRVLHLAGASFDVASPAEVRACLAAGARADDLVLSNPVVRRADLEEMAGLGVRLIVVDSPQAVVKVAAVAPDASVLCRLVTSGEGSDWPLSRKYGVCVAEAVEVLTLADQLGLDAAGVSFHVGSQQNDPTAWQQPIAAAARVFGALRGRRIFPRILDLGGGFPARLSGEEPDVWTYGQVIRSALAAVFGDDPPRTIIEPGRGVVADAGVLVSTVVDVVERGGARWVFLDAGVFTGLVETLDEAIRYPVTTSRDGGPVGPCVVAGPTCDSVDVLYQQVQLPLDLTEGDEVRFHGAGAYTTCYSTVGFNGFPPLPTVLLGDGRW